MTRFAALVATIAVPMFAFGGAVAEAAPAPPATPAPATAGAAGGWQHTAAVYLLAAGMSGKSSIGNLDADVDVSFSEILDHLEAGGMAAYRGTNGTWAVMVNSLFMGLGGTKDGPLGGSAEVDLDQTMLEVDGSRRIAKGLELYFGLRYNDIDATLEVRPIVGTTQTGNEKHSWIDPLVGLRCEVPMGSKWSFVGRADVGGFGVGSDFAWSAMTHFDWRISKHFGTAFGYTALDMDYEDGEGSDFFGYDVLTTGPFAAATFHF